MATHHLFDARSKIAAWWDLIRCRLYSRDECLHFGGRAQCDHVAPELKACLHELQELGEVAGFSHEAIAVECIDRPNVFRVFRAGSTMCGVVEFPLLT